MNKIIYIFAYLLCLPTFGQVVAGEPNWGSWGISECYSGISYRIGGTNYKHSDGTLGYALQIKNNYSKAVYLDYGVGDNDADLENKVRNRSGDVGRTMLRPNGIANIGLTNLHTSYSNNLSVVVGHLYFEKDFSRNSWEYNHVKCDAGGKSYFCINKPITACNEITSNSAATDNQSSSNETKQSSSKSQQSDAQSQQNIQPANQYSATDQAIDKAQQSLQQVQSSITQLANTTNNAPDKDYIEKTQNLEMLKFADTEPEFNTISSPDDYNSVSMTTNRNFANLFKVGQLEIEKWGYPGPFDITKKNAIRRAKVEAAFMGANTINVKSMNMSYVKPGLFTCPKVDIYAVVYMDKPFSIDVVNQLIQKDNSFKIKHQYTFMYKSVDLDDSNFEKKDSKKNIVIQNVAQNPKDKSINITAQIEGSKNPLIYKLVSFTEDQFVLMLKENIIDKYQNDKTKYTNYVVKLK